MWAAAEWGMTHAHDPTTRVRYEERVVEERPAPVETHEHVSPAATLALVLTRLVYTAFGVLEVLVFVRFILKLGDANPANGVVATIDAITEPLVGPFIGTFSVPRGAVTVDLPPLIAIAFLVLVEALCFALIRAASPRY